VKQVEIGVGGEKERGSAQSGAEQSATRPLDGPSRAAQAIDF